MGKQNSRGCGWVRILGVCLGLVSTGRASAAERRVPADYGTIQAAINASVAGDEVVIAPGIYKGDGNRDLDLLGKAITVRSQDPNDWAVVQATVIDCLDWSTHRGFYFHSGEGPDSRVVGLTVRNGAIRGIGGGIACESSSPSIERCWIAGCLAEIGGGGIAAYEGSPRITGCVIRDNGLTGEFPLPIGGGGIFSVRSKAVIRDCLIVNNSTSYDYSTKLWGYGGGVAAYEPTSPAEGIVVRLVNCTIVGNQGCRVGGGIGCDESLMTVENCVVWGNRAEEAGTEQIVGNPLVSYSDVQGGYTGEGNIDADPCFSSFSGNYQLMAGSPCIDAGMMEPNAGLSAIDIDGSSRLVDGDGDGGERPDMGAYERPGSGALILVDKPFVEMVGWVGGPTPDAKSVSVVRDGSGVVSWSITMDCSWLRASPSSGELIGQATPVSISVDPNGLPVGDHLCHVYVTGAGSLVKPVTIGVLLRVRAIRHVPSEYPTIQSAIDAAGEYDTVLVAEGTYRGVGNRDLDPGGKAIIIRGENGAEKTILDCEGMGRGFYCHQRESAETVLEDLSITNGSDGSIGNGGAGVFCYYSSPTIRRCIISGNRSQYEGGGIACNYSQAQILNCIVKGNIVYGAGGGIQLGTTPGLVIRNSLIIGNTALQGGGGVCVGLSAVVEGCTVAANTAGGSGGGILIGGRSNGAASTGIVSNCIVWGNSAPNGPQIAQHTSPGGVSFWFSDVQGGPNAFHKVVSPDGTSRELIWGEGCIDADPLFKDPYGPDGDANTWQDNDYHLSVYSPCKNTGDPNGDYAGQTDMDGEARRMGGQVDMGADERSYFWVECGSGGGEVLGLLAMMGMWFVRRRS